jgi:hypothetical protein
MIKSRTKRVEGHVALMSVKMNAYRVLAGNLDGKTPLVVKLFPELN